MVRWFALMGLVLLCGCGEMSADDVAAVMGSGPPQGYYSPDYRPRGLNYVMGGGNAPQTPIRSTTCVPNGISIICY